VEFRISGSDYKWEWEKRYHLGLDTWGDWKLNTQWEHELNALDAIAAGKLALRLDKKMIAMGREYGEAPTARDCLRRAVLAIKPVALRINSSYSGKSGVDANRQWHDVRKNLGEMAEHLICREMNEFRDALQKARPVLFLRPETGVAS
jgi:hypothetical protein